MRLKIDIDIKSLVRINFSKIDDNDKYDILLKVIYLSCYLTKKSTFNSY